MTKWDLASDQSSVKSWLVQPIKELSSAAGLCAGRGCALIKQLANCIAYSCQSWVDQNYAKFWYITGSSSTFTAFIFDV